MFNQKHYERNMSHLANEQVEDQAEDPNSSFKRDHLWQAQHASDGAEMEDSPWLVGREHFKVPFPFRVGELHDIFLKDDICANALAGETP